MREDVSKSLKSCPSEVLVPKSLISKIFEPFLKSCPSEVRVPWGRVPRGLTVLTFEKQLYHGLFQLNIYIIYFNAQDFHLILYEVHEHFTCAVRGRNCGLRCFKIGAEFIICVVCRFT